MTPTSAQAAPIVPRPSSSEVKGPGMTLADGLVIAFGDQAAAPVAQLLRSELEAATGWTVHLGGAGARGEAGVVRLDLDEVAGGPAGGRHGSMEGRGGEGYRLEVGATETVITAPSAAGLFYGTRTLRQLLPEALLRRAPLHGQGPVHLDGWVIEDSPRFPWRGLLLDVSRHFFPKEFLMKLVDLAALHKLNVLHLHLTDDQGWRFQVERYPLLTQVGAWRRESPAGHYEEGRTDGTPHGGFYTKEDLAEVASYADRHFVTVVPEVDMPGHMLAAIAAYPRLGNTGEQFEVYTNWGVSDHVLNMEESTVRFCADVLEEVMDVFPSPYVHIGGDECPTTEWEASPLAQARWQELGLAGPRQLQGWFTARMAEVVTARGRRLASWDEVVDAGAPPGSVVTAWRADQALRAATEAAHAGLDVVMAPEPWCYLDWSYADDEREPLAIKPAISVEKVYSLEPVPAGLPASLEHHVLGAQCQLWTEYVHTPQHAEYMYFPRACALAEATWSTGERSWPEFEVRLAGHTRRLDALGVNYRPLAGPTPGQARTWSATTPQ